MRYCRESVETEYHAVCPGVLWVKDCRPREEAEYAGISPAVLNVNGFRMSDGIQFCVSDSPRGELL